MEVDSIVSSFVEKNIWIKANTNVYAYSPYIYLADIIYLQ